MRTIGIDDLDFVKGGGLIPVVVQDARSLQILTLAYTNKEALELTIKTGFAHFFRRSHNKVMKKGVTSGYVQRVVGILADCDVDSVTFLIEPKGPACHKGESSCFHFQLSE